MSKEERAKVARENGSKSHGPTSEEGKSKSARNGIKTREFAQKLAAFVPRIPPSSATKIAKNTSSSSTSLSRSTLPSTKSP